MISALSLTIIGYGSAIVGGVISDKFEKRSYMTKSYLIIAGNVMAIPLAAIACLAGNFWVAVAAFSMKILVSGSYLAPAITMMQNSTENSNAGLIVSSYTFFSHFAQTLAPILFGYFAKSYGAMENPRVYGYLIATFVMIGYAGSNYFYLKAGREYEKIMRAKENKII